MQCAAFDCELSGVIRGKFTGLVCVLNTLAYARPAVFWRGGGLHYALEGDLNTEAARRKSMNALLNTSV